MTFQILPAIDVARGRLVSVSADETREVQAFSGSPLAAAEAFVSAGARWLHVVDVDRANGRGSDLGLLHELAGVGAKVQASGGISSIATAEEALEAGADRVVLSSSVLSDRDLTAELAHGVGTRAVIGIEADGDVIRPRGGHAVELPLDDTLAWLRRLHPARYLYTGLARVANLTGPDLAGLREAAAILGRPVTAAGGIGTPDDVLALRDLGPSIVDGCVIGRALYEGLDLRTVLRMG